MSNASEILKQVREEFTKQAEDREKWEGDREYAALDEFLDALEAIDGFTIESYRSRWQREVMDETTVLGLAEWVEAKEK